MSNLELAKPTIVEQSVYPQSLEDARAAVLALPGIKQYVPDQSVSIPEIDTALETMVEQVTLQLDAENMMQLITDNMGWSDAQSAEFFSHPERQPYQSAIELSFDWTERAQQFLTIGTYLRYKYFDIKESVPSASNQEGATNNSQHAGENLRMFFEYSMYNLFAPSSFDLGDRFYGIDPTDRRNGTIHPTTEMTDLMDAEVARVAKETATDQQILLQKVLSATEGGNFITSMTFLVNNKGKPEVRRVLEAMFEKRAHDPTIAMEKLQLLWATETFRMAMGIDLELYYELDNLPDGQTIESRLHKFLIEDAYVENALQHARTEATQAVQDWKQTHQPMNYWSILEERAKYHNFPDTVSLPSELEAKKQRVWDELQGILPLGFIETPLSTNDAPTAIGATQRAVNITYHNAEDRIVNVVVLNARDHEDRLRSVGGHEIAHKLHAELLRRAEIAGYIPKGSVERVPSPVKEEFSQLVESQVAEIWKDKQDATTTDEDKKENGAKPSNEFRDLYHAIIQRRQAPYALTQRAIRLEMERMWHSGKRDALT